MLMILPTNTNSDLALTEKKIQYFFPISCLLKEAWNISLFSIFLLIMIILKLTVTKLKGP